MVRWFLLFRQQWCGFFALGLLLFALQELPYIVMPFISLSSNPLMGMQNQSAALNALEKVLGVSCIVTMLFLVRGDARWFSLGTTKELVFFSLAIVALLGYYIGWIFYFTGHQSLPLILCLLVAMPPLYYAFIGLWRGNDVLAVLGGFFLCTHLTNVWNNLK